MKCRDDIGLGKDAVNDRIVAFSKLVYRFEYHISSGRMCDRIDLMEKVGLLTVDLELLDVYKKIYSDVFLIWTAEQVAECSPASYVFGIECKCSPVMNL